MITISDGGEVQLRSTSVIPSLSWIESKKKTARLAARFSRVAYSTKLHVLEDNSFDLRTDQSKDQCCNKEEWLDPCTCAGLLLVLGRYNPLEPDATFYREACKKVVKSRRMRDRRRSYYAAWKPPPSCGGNLTLSISMDSNRLQFDSKFDVRMTQKCALLRWDISAGMNVMARITILRSDQVSFLCKG